MQPRVYMLVLCLSTLVAGPTLAAEKLILQLRWVPQSQIAGYYAAQDRGFYAGEGLDVEIRAGGPKIDPAKLAAAGQADVIVDWMPAAAVLRPGYTVYVEEGDLFAATAWFIFVNGEVVIDTDAHVWYPETVTFAIDIPPGTGTVTWADIPIMSATRTQFLFTNRNEVNGDLTVRYGLDGAATPGPVGTCTATMIAEVAAGTVNVDDDSSLLISGLNR